MQNVLSIDISSKSAEVVVASIEGKSIQILERHNLDIGDFLLSLAHHPNRNGHLAGMENGAGEEENTINPENTENNQNINPILQILSKVTTPWNNAILTVPAYDYLSLNMELPFNDNRSINRILDLEIQDLVPFDIEQFHLCHKSIAQVKSDENDLDIRYDTHIGIISKPHINKIMELCHQANFEPFIVTTPSAAIGSVLTLAPLYFAENSLIFLERLPDYYIITTFDGLIRTEKIITHPSFQQHTNGHDSRLNMQDAGKLILLDLKLFIASNEKRYQRNIDKVYFFGKNFSAGELQTGLARSVEILKTNEFIPVESEEPSIAAFAAVYAEENNAGQIINNFRARQYAYNQKLKYLLRASKALLPSLGILAAGIILYLGTSFVMTEYKIRRLNSAINTEIRSVLPAMTIAQGAELSTMQAENQKLEEQLNDISSLSSMTPLDLLLEVFKDLPSTLGLSVKSVKIKDNKIVVEGAASKYNEVDNVKKILEKKPIYERVKRNETSSVSAFPGMRPFSFEIWVKE